MDELEERKQWVRQHLERAHSLPTLPVVIARVIGMVDRPQTSSRQLGDEIAKDQVLTAKVLKLVNSGFYGFSRPISTITHAVTMLGFDAVKGLVLGCSALEDMEEALPGLWEHSLACARTCAFIAEHRRMGEVEELSVSGLLHDLGKVVLYQGFAQQFYQVRSLVETGDLLFYEAENEVLGAHHGLVGGWLLEKWTLPAKLVAPVSDHHDFRPHRSHAEWTAVVHLADVLCRAEALGNGGDRKVPQLQPAALKLLDLGLEDIRRIMERLDAELDDIPRM
ncbi:MAG: HDOD domain-containing protein [Candidatus Handelsmanbacteria bacterium]|nr:HDOD domain-containing protein [Candidatus Handelsmanbacteria bacterium]